MSSPSPAIEIGRRELWIGLGCATLVLAVWTGFHIVTRLGVRSNFPPQDLMALRLGAGGLIMLPWFLRRGFGNISFWRAIALAVPAGIGFTAFAFWGYTFAPVSHAVALMTGTVPLQTAILAMIVLGERFGPIKLTGLALTVGGVFLVGLEGLMIGAPGQWRGDIMFFLASTSWVIYTILAQRWRVAPVEAASVVYIVCAVLYLPLYFLLFEPQFHLAPIDEIAIQVLMQGILSTVVTLMAFTRVIQILGATAGSMLTAAVPAITTLIAIPLVGEIPDTLAIIGIACVTAGIVATLMTLRRPGA